jgi:putative exosortase-associated protein (TIGR04073 family)
MKKLLCFLLITCVTAVVYADIQDPPANDQGPTRKLGRGISNVLYGSTEFWTTLCIINNGEGNAAAGSYGIVKGLGRTFARFWTGLYEIATFPIPTTNGTYRSPLKSDIPWIHGGYSEFPPELGWETKYNYSRSQTPS